MWASIISIPLHSPPPTPGPLFPVVLGVCRGPAFSEERLTRRRVRACRPQSVRSRKPPEAGKNGWEAFRTDAPRRSCSLPCFQKGPGIFPRAPCRRDCQKRGGSAVGLCPQVSQSTRRAPPQGALRGGGSIREHCLTWNTTCLGVFEMQEAL